MFVLFLEELAAHSSNVNCLAFGRKSGRVMVTGGDDKKVNLWAVGKPNCIMVSVQIFIVRHLHFLLIYFLKSKKSPDYY